MEKSLFWEEYWVKIVSTLILHWSCRIEIASASNNLIIWTHLGFQTRFTPQMLTWVLWSRSQSLVFSFCWNVSLKSLTFCPYSEILSDQNWQKVLLVSYILTSPSLNFPSTCQSIACCLKKSSMSFTSDLESWWTKMGKKFSEWSIILIFQPDLLKNDIFEFIYQGLNWQRHLFELFSDGTNFNCDPQTGLLISWICKKFQLMFLVCRFSNWLSSKAISLNSFDKVSIEMF